MKSAADTARKHVGFGLPRGKRLSSADVVQLLKRGRRVQCRSFDVQYQVAGSAGLEFAGRIAIATPKKLLATAVARNRIKRLVREVFRQSDASGLALDVLFKYRLKSDCRFRVDRLQVRAELARLLSALIARSGAA